MFEAYFDLSTAARADALVVAGYIAAGDQWKHFDREWKEFLADEDLTFFHMTDCENRRKEFEGWDEKRKLRAIKRAHGIIKCRTNIAISAGIILPDYQAVLFDAPDVAKELGSPFFLCVNGCLREIAKWIEKYHRKGEPIAYIFEEGDEGKGEIMEMFRKISGDARLKAGCGYESFRFANKRIVTPLQAADINAYESWKHMINQITIPTPLRPIRKSMWSLAGHPNQSRYFDREELLGLTEKLRQKQLRDATS